MLWPHGYKIWISYTRTIRRIRKTNHYAAHPGGVSICGSVEVPSHIVQGLAAIQIIRARPNNRFDALGHQFCLEGFGALLAEKGLAVIVRHCGALRNRCFVVS